MTSGDVPDSTTSRSSHSASGHSDAALGGRIDLGKGFLWICLGEHKKTHTYNYIYILYNVYMYIFPVDSIVLLDFSMQRIQNMFSKSSGNQDWNHKLTWIHDWRISHRGLLLYVCQVGSWQPHSYVAATSNGMVWPNRTKKMKPTWEGIEAKQHVELWRLISI